MAIAVAVALSLFCLAIVVYPLAMARRAHSATREEVVAPPDALDFQTIMEAIEILRLDYDLGKVGPDQYREQLQGYRLAAAYALQRQSQAGLNARESLLEEEVLAARSRLGNPGSPAGDSSPAPTNQAPTDQAPTDQAPTNQPPTETSTGR